MPHIIIKLWPGKSEEQKKELADRIANSMTEIMAVDDKNISIAFEEVEKEKWNEEVYQPDILAKEKLLYKNPGYKM